MIPGLATLTGSSSLFGWARVSCTANFSLGGSHIRSRSGELGLPTRAPSLYSLANRPRASQPPQTYPPSAVPYQQETFRPPQTAPPTQGVRWFPDSGRRPYHAAGLRVATPLLADFPDTGRLDSEWESEAVC